MVAGVESVALAENLTVAHCVRWMAPSALWAEQSTAGVRVAGAGHAQAVPSLLRFATDEFMAELLQMAETAPHRIGEYVAQPETWREPVAGMPRYEPPVRESAVGALLGRVKRDADARRAGLRARMDAFSHKSLKVPEPIIPPAPSGAPLKLYHSAHQRHYLVGASLICGEPGLPDAPIRINEGERVSFVLRRLVPPADTNKETAATADASWEEYAFVARGNGHVWQHIGKHDAPATRELMPEEDRAPLFPITHPGDCCERRMHCGVIPVAKREQLMGAPAEGGVAAAADTRATSSPEPAPFEQRSHARKMFQQDVAEPWKALINQAQYRAEQQSRGAPKSFEVEEGDDKYDAVVNEITAERNRVFATTRDQLQSASWYVLLDFANFLDRHLPRVWTSLNERAFEGALSRDEVRLIEILSNTRLDTRLHGDLLKPITPVTPASYTSDDVYTDLVTALREIKNFEADLESVEKAFRYREEGAPTEQDEPDDPSKPEPKWPTFLFPLADPGTTQYLRGPVPRVLDLTEPTGNPPFEDDKQQIDALADLIELIARQNTEPSGGTQVVERAVQLDHKYAFFTIRCVYERPRCGPLFPALVSAPSRMFQMAPFFDPDAPARPIRIPMPIDITPAGLRKYNRNASFVISDMLCGRLKRVKKYTLGDLVLSVLPWPFHKDLPDPGETGPCAEGGSTFGMICSLSIPIVTLCAFILLIIMVTLFDMFFRWLPFLMLCLPIPGLKAKS